MKICASFACILLSLTSSGPLLAGQAHAAGGQPKGPVEDLAAVARGQKTFQSTCGFCHGNDATGSRAPDLLRSSILSHDVNGSSLTPVIQNGRPDKGMPAFPNLRPGQISDIVTFLHHQSYLALHSAHVPGDYPLAKLLTGNAEAGKTYFQEHCANCHSATGDLAGVAKKYSPIDLQQHMVYPSAKSASKTAVVKLKDGTTCQGKLMHQDAFNVSIYCQDGWYRSWPTDQVDVQIHDPLEQHRELMTQYTDADIHNLFAYLETLK